MQFPPSFTGLYFPAVGTQSRSKGKSFFFDRSIIFEVAPSMRFYPFPDLS